MSHSGTESVNTEGSFTRIWSDPQCNKETSARLSERSGWLIDLKHVYHQLWRQFSTCTSHENSNLAQTGNSDLRAGGMVFLCSPRKNLKWTGAGVCSADNKSVSSGLVLIKCLWKTEVSLKNDTEIPYFFCAFRNKVSKWSLISILALCCEIKWCVQIIHTALSCVKVRKSWYWLY